MNDDQLAAIVSLMAGMQLSIVHLSNVVANNTGISKDDLASSFEETAQAIPSGVMNREAIQASVMQIARGIRGAATGPDWNDLMSRLKH